jgi:glucose/mannose-6-phosphate isomerase
MKEKRSEIYALIEDFPEQVRNSYNLDISHVKLHHEFKRIVIFGMGGSYIGGYILKRLVEDEIKIPVQVCNSTLKSAEKDTLLILSSYSGNTKEVLEVFRRFRKRHLLVISSGGKLISFAKKHRMPFIKVPENLHQRFTVSYGIFPLLKIFEGLKLIKPKKKFVDKIVKDLHRNRYRIENEGIKLSLMMRHRTPLFYSSSFFYPLAYRLQTSLEEDAKTICHSNKITELFHNELECFPNHYSIPILIIDKKETKRFSKQIDYFRRLVRDHFEFGFEKFQKEERMMFGIYMADFLGYYFSKIKDTPIGETPLSDEIKKL